MDKPNNAGAFRKETYVVGYKKAFYHLLLNAEGDFEPIADLRELWLVRQFQDFESAESLALQHNASVFEVWKKSDKLVLLQWQYGSSLEEVTD